MNYNTKKYCFFIFICLTTIFVEGQEKTTKNSYNYSEISEHPRLLLNKNEEIKVVEAVNKSPELKKVHDYIIETSNEILKMPLLTREMKGKRLLAVSRNAFSRLYFLSYSYRLTRQEKYLKKAEQELNNISKFSDWNPSHFLDVGEMTMGAAIAYDWLHHKLQDSTKQNVRKAIIEKAFQPSYIEKYNWFLTKHSNWNSVCNAGLVFGALAIMEDEKEQSIPIIERALKTNILALEVFAPDGNYPEGPGYWNYGTTFQVMLSAALESALGNDQGLSQSPGFMTTSNYMLFANGPSGKFFNYYDCSATKEPSSSLFWFADKNNEPSIALGELEMIKNGLYTRAKPSDVDRILPNTIIFGKNINLTTMKPPVEKLFVGHGLTPVAIVRTSWDGSNEKYLGIKAGSASDGHSHMDQGTFVYDIGQLRWAMDLGLQSYNTLESQGVDLWNMNQNSQRWDVFKYNNFNHNTISINNQKHNVKGRAKIIESYKNKELGAKIDLTEVLNFKNELKSATRKATIVNEKNLVIIDEIETNADLVSLRWNMVTPAKAEIIDKNTIKLTQDIKILFLKFESNIAFDLVLRPSENPSEIETEFGIGKYGEYNQKNAGTVMLGFDAKIPGNTKAQFKVTFEEGKSDIILNNNTIVLNAPNPSRASEGDKVFFDNSTITISGDGDAYTKETPDWAIYGKITHKKALNKNFGFRIDPKRITPQGLENAGIDRSADGQLGIRGGEGNGIDKNEGYFFGLDLSEFDSSVTFKLTKIGINLLEGNESCIIVNRKNLSKMMNYSPKNKNLQKRIAITNTLNTKMVDISELGILLKGGENHIEFMTLFNTSDAGNFRISGFEFEVQ